MIGEQQWWQTGVIYQIYPRSFQDSGGDGVGDLRGITARLDYLAALGVEAIWISPFYPSPMADFGYDVADYTGVDPLFGNLADFDALLAAAHAKGLRVILDFVPNHSSDQHPWFLESRSSRTNPKRDWYLWHDPVPYPWLQPGQDQRPPSAQEPNNWMSHFGGPAWTWDETTEQFYLHSFLKEQPDLNWRNPEVRAAIYAAMRFWLDRGVDGFRMDVLWLLIKDAQFRSNPPNDAFEDTQHDHKRVIPVYNADQPETLQIVAQMRALLDEYGPTLGAAGPSNRVLIGEIYLPLVDLVRYYGVPQLEGANLPFNFHLIQTQWNAAAIAQIVQNYEALLPASAWPNYVLGNHDQSRLATRVGPRQARAAAMMLLTLRGTPTLYYGDELGMTDVPIAPDQVQDPAEKNEPGKGRGRDPERSPMLWVDAPNAGFTTPDATPWLPLLADWKTLNAATQSRDPRSMLTLYRRLLALRRQHDTLHAGAITEVAAEGSVLRFRRVALPDGESTDVQVLLNLGTEVATVQCAPGTIVLTTLLDGEGAAVDGPVQIEAGEGLLIALD
jgi:alpha-glucosidase